MDPPLATKRCLNCDHDVAITTFQLHEAFCHRNVKVCPRCKATVLAQSMEEHLKGCGSEMTPPPEAIEDHTTEEPPPTHECAVSSEDLQEVPCEVCGASFPFSCLEDHVRQCHTCEHCGVVIPDRDHREHQEKFCSVAPRKCKYCELTFNNQDYISHVEACGSRTEVCEGCLSYVTLKDMDEHTMTCWQGGDSPLEPLIHEVRDPWGRGRGHCPKCCCCCALL